MPADTGPYQNERQAVTAALAVIRPETGHGILRSQERRELLRQAFAGANVEVSDFEDGTAWWLCNWEEYTIAVIAGWITRAHEAGKAAALEGAETEYGVRYTCRNYLFPDDLPELRVDRAASRANAEKMLTEPGDTLVCRGTWTGPWEVVPGA